MRISLLLFSLMIFSFTILLVSCSDTTNKDILGEWTWQDNSQLNQGHKSVGASWGDITFTADSTFIIHGDSKGDTSTAPISGWHVGGEMKGRWQIEKKQLLLKPEELQTKFFLTYEIIKLTSTRLVLLSAFDKGDTTKYIIYSRKK